MVTDRPGEDRTVYRCLLNPDVEIPEDMLAAHLEWCLACWGRMPIPGTLGYEIARFNAAVNTAWVEILREASATIRRLVNGLRRFADRGGDWRGGQKIVARPTLEPKSIPAKPSPPRSSSRDLDK